jgi:hypothetical protein
MGLYSQIAIAPNAHLAFIAGQSAIDRQREFVGLRMSAHAAVGVMHWAAAMTGYSVITATFLLSIPLGKSDLWTIDLPDVALGPTAQDSS